MKAPAKPHNEKARLQALINLNLLDSGPEERFDRLTRIAKRLFQVPIAMVSLVDMHRQWSKSCFGLDRREYPRDLSFCGHAILQEDTFVVPNTLKDDRFFDNPLVEGEPNIRFYAGTPLKTADGHVIGTLCILDKIPRLFHSEDIDMLEDLARMVEREIRAIQLATMDELTGISNRRGFYLIAEHSLSLSFRHKSPATIVIIKLGTLATIIEQVGDQEGSRVLTVFAQELQRFFRESDLVARLGGDKFAVMLLNTGTERVAELLAKLQRSMQHVNANVAAHYKIEHRVGLATFDPLHPKTIHQLVEQADQALLEAVGI